jgi:hypothetical protein
MTPVNDDVAVFERLLKEANLAAARASLEPDVPTLVGECVVVTGLRGRKRSLALKLGAHEIDVGVLFEPAEGIVPNTPSIRSKRNWAHTFEGIMQAAGYRAYVFCYEDKMKFDNQ